MAASLGRRHLLGSRSRPFFRRRERTRCRSLFFFCPFLRGLGRLGTRLELCLPPSKPFRPRNGERRQYSGWTAGATKPPMSDPDLASQPPALVLLSKLELEKCSSSTVALLPGETSTSVPAQATRTAWRRSPH